MLRRLLYSLAWAVAGYMLGVMVSFTAVSIVLAKSVNDVSNRGPRDRWAFILALVGLFAGAMWGWWHTSGDTDHEG